MKLFLYLTDMIVPFMIFAILAYGVQKKVRVYDTFIEGAREGLLTVVKIVPTLIGLISLIFWQELWGGSPASSGFPGSWSRFLL